MGPTGRSPASNWSSLSLRSPSKRQGPFWTFLDKVSCFCAPHPLVSRIEPAPACRIRSVRTDPGNSSRCGAHPPVHLHHSRAGVSAGGWLRGQHLPAVALMKEPRSGTGKRAGDRGCRGRASHSCGVTRCIVCYRPEAVSRPAPLGVLTHWWPRVVDTPPSRAADPP